MTESLPIISSKSLAPLSYLKVGGTATHYIQVANAIDLKHAVTYANNNKLPVYIFGQASNLIFPDENFSGLIIKLASRTEPELLRQDKHVVLEIFAGYAMTALARWSAQQGWSGLEWAYGLPGTVGGAIRGNAGCYGGETGDYVQSVKWLNVDRPDKIRISSQADCQFSYRDSIFKKHPERIIISAVIQLQEGQPADIVAKQSEFLAQRNAKFPHLPNTGSFFKNIEVSRLSQKAKQKLVDLIGTPLPEVVPTGQILDILGYKRRKHGSAMVSEEHANVLVNLAKKGRASDFKALAGEITQEIEQKIGVKLEPEVQFVKWPSKT